MYTDNYFPDLPPTSLSAPHSFAHLGVSRLSITVCLVDLCKLVWMVALHACTCNPSPAVRPRCAPVCVRLAVVSAYGPSVNDVLILFH